MVERFNVVSISLFKCTCCHAYVVFCAICVACSDCGLVNYVFSHAFFLERACFLVPASAWVYDLTLWLAYRLDKVSYSCMNNVKSIISKHNTRIAGRSKPQCEVIDPCTCRDKKTCPLQEKCMTKSSIERPILAHLTLGFDLQK